MSALIERIVEISEQNPELVSREIAAQLQCRDAYVRSIWQRFGIKRNTGYRGSTPLPNVIHRRVCLHRTSYRRFIREAERRSVSLEALLDGILETVAQDNLFTAVLDD